MASDGESHISIGRYEKPVNAQKSSPLLRSTSFDIPTRQCCCALEPPLPVIAANLGHADTRMTERHYAHLAPGYVAEVIRATMPRLGLIEASALPRSP
jgi:integrase